MKPWKVALMCFGLLACRDDGGSTGAAHSLADTVGELRAEYGLASLALGVFRGGRLVEAAAAGMADIEADIPADIDTIYMLASTSKPVVGLAAARLMELEPDFDLDADVSEWLGWELYHPEHPDHPVTMRQLLRHESGIATDGPADYETYPKPDPDTPLAPFLAELLGTAAGWTEAAPGEAYNYSNLGVALAALVIEEVAGVPFDVFCTRELFDPLGMDDTRWFHRAYSREQRQRLARPYDEALDPYDHYAFNDYPSGLLRTTVADFARLLEMLMADGDGVLSPASVEAFETLPMLIERDDEGALTAWEHSGGEAGVNTYFVYREDGSGYLFLTNTDVADDDLDALLERLSARY